MAYQVFNLPPQQPLSAAGRVLPGSKLYFYLTTTSTPVNVWTTSALNVAHSQPLIADAGGRFAAVYLDPTVTYKATVTDANDVLLYTIDPVNDQLLSQAIIGEYLYPRTPAEISAGVTPTNHAYKEGNVLRYYSGSGSIAAAWADANAQAADGGSPIFLPSGGYDTATELTASHLADIIFEAGAYINVTASSSATGVWLNIGSTNPAEICFSRKYEGLWVQRQSLSDWASENDVGIRINNAAGCTGSIAQVNGFTIGFQAMPAGGAGFQGNTITFGHIYNCKIARDWTNATSGFCNDNTAIGGRIQLFSGINNSSARYGDRITSSDASYVNNNGNRFYGPLIELNAADSSAEAVAVHVVHGDMNHWFDIRSEGNDLTGRFSNASQRNCVEVLYNDSAAVGIEQLNTASQNIVVLMDRRPRTHFVYPIAEFHDLGRKARGTSGTSILIEGLTWGTSGSATRSAVSSTSVTYDGNYITIPTTRAMGLYIDVSANKELLIRRTGTAGGRVRVTAYDSSDNILSAAGTVVGSQASPVSYDGSSFGGSWGVGSDFLSDVYLRFSSTTAYVWVFVTGGTSSAAVSSFGVYAPAPIHGSRAYTSMYTSPGEITGGAYTVTNLTPDRSYDANTVAIAELADVVGTLITDLQTLRILR